MSEAHKYQWREVGVSISISPERWNAMTPEMQRLVLAEADRFNFRNVPDTGIHEEPEPPVT